MDRRNPLSRLYRTKMALLATISTALGIALLVVAQLPAIQQITLLPLKDIGSALLTTGLIAILFEYVNSRDADERANQRLRAIIREQAPVIRDTVIDGFAFNTEQLARVASPDTMHRLITNSLADQLGDRELATDMYTDLRQQVQRSDERHYDTHITIHLTPWTQGPATGEGAMFVATIRREYRTAAPPLVSRFSCVSNPTEYQNLLRDPTSAGVWLFDPTASLNADSPEVFSLVQYTINGTAQPIEHTQRPGAQIFTVTSNPEDLSTNADCYISHTIRVLAPQHGHLLFLDFNRPSKGLRVDFTHDTDCDIAHVNILDFLASAQRPRILRNPKEVPTQMINIAFDGWIFPKSGIAYTWTLNQELQGPHHAISIT